MPVGKQSDRNEAIDILRGLVMVIMVLDHARDFWGGFTPDPTDLDVTTPALFFTRWVTHFCAPVFVFLAGTSAYLYGSRREPIQLSRFLLTRGLWLILIELTVCKYVWIPEPGYSMVLMQVIWAIGCSMIVLAGLCFFGAKIVGLIGLLIIVGHNTLDSLVPADFGSASALWTLAHEGGVLRLSDGASLLVGYPVLPWIGVMAIGYSFGLSMSLSREQRQTLYLRLGLAMIAVFILLRATNFYGDSSHWSAQSSTVFSLLSFLNATKYPPSLLYLLMTLGPALCLLAVFEKESQGRLRTALLVFGRVPLLFYILHLYLLRFTAVPVSF
ncbi:MAG: heparan-alpha-glucosaminide N-acetyltransferase domain-containing protein, partial [Halioglobus sp.]